MLLTRIYLRHYKSFNYDYERKAEPKPKIEPWEADEDGWQPFVRVPLERDITAIVGANESGKSHLLDAIEILLGGTRYDQNDFCRYSALYSVEEGQRRWPQFAGVFTVTDDERTALRELGLPPRSEHTVLIVRRNPEAWSAIDAGGVEHPLATGRGADLIRLLPTSFRLRTDLPLPDSLSIRQLQGLAELPARGPRTGALEVFAEQPFSTAEALTALIPALLAAMQRQPAREGSDVERTAAQQRLGSDLLRRVARIDDSVFAQLAAAVVGYREGPVNGLIQKMNEAIGRHLNLERWWSQDRSFSLRVSPREHELVFTIHDRTGTDYSFAERSTGLRYFLSYFVQLRAHARIDTRPEILLMDEPDTYLSASGQQDLLRVLEHYVSPEGLPSDDQVVYVTHSPFLLNKNAGRRARVIDKGSSDEGTRLVRDATQNRYEPLRSAVGAFVAETAFIGGTNLFVEGASDQIYLVELSNRLRAAGTAPSKLLELNSTTIVGAGSASAIPYMVYLARGQDEIKPPCVVLLDSDDSGQQAARALRRGGAYRKRLIDDRWIQMLGDWATAQGDSLALAPGVVVNETEDLLPVGCAVAAARAYAVEFLGLTEREAGTLTEELVLAQLITTPGSLFDALCTQFRGCFDAHLDKVGFAKEVIRFLGHRTADDLGHGVAELDNNFGLLIAHLAETLRAADRAEEAGRRTKRLARTIDGFLRDHPEPVSKDTADVMHRDAETAADESDQGDQIRAAIASLRRDFALVTDPLLPVQDYDTFRDRLAGLRYVERLANQGRLDHGDADSNPASAPEPTAAAPAEPAPTVTPPLKPSSAPASPSVPPPPTEPAGPTK